MRAKERDKVGECQFCKDITIKKRRVGENKFSWAFLTNAPITVGHTLITPKRCIAKIGDLKMEDIEAIFNLAESVKKSLIKAYNSEGFNVAYNENKIAGQSVPHFHLHVVARKRNDLGIYNYEPREFLHRPGRRGLSPQFELENKSREIRRYIQLDEGCVF